VPSDIFREAGEIQPSSEETSGRNGTAWRGNPENSEIRQEQSNISNKLAERSAQNTESSKKKAQNQWKRQI
jgi:hypothetical protein